MEKYWELTQDLKNSINHEVINEYLLSMKLANRSEGTIKQYRRFLERFYRDKKTSYFEMKSETIQEWFIKNESHVKEATLSLRLSILSSFYNFCVQEEYINRSPMKMRWFPRIPKSVPKYLEKPDIAKARQFVEKSPLRNQALLEFMLSSGCRVGETHLLDYKEVDLENRTARVLGKGKKIRQVHFSERCAILIESYLKTHPRTNHALFLTSEGKRLSIRAIQQILHVLGEKAGLSGPLHPHRLRHTFATEMLAKGAELSFISEEMGHRSIGTTQIYARLPKREIMTMYRKYMG